MTTLQLTQVQIDWSKLASIIYVPRTEAEYSELRDHLDQLIDVVGSNEEHPLASLMAVIGSLIEQYEDEHYPLEDDGDEYINETDVTEQP
jgi:HTH-type transcriptional regulator / antitoxin HigA